MIGRRALVAVAVTLCGLVALAPAAGADPAEPGNYRSKVLCVVPVQKASTTTSSCADAAEVPFTAKVVGGDGFLDLTVERGHTVEIPGYTGEPWLRIDEKGTVQENQASSATYLNESRYGSAQNTDIPDWVSIERATKHPQWKTVGHGGHYVWHDHRIHYMTPQITPTLVAGTNRVAISDRDDGLWYIPLTVDGHEHQILGELREFPAPSPLPQWGLAAFFLVVLAGAGLILHGPAGRVAAGTLLVIGALALWAGISELAAVPALAGGNPIWVALPIVSVVLAIGALAVRGAAARSIAVLASAASLGVWAVLRVPAFDKAVPLGSIDPTLTRLIIAAALGTAAGSIVAAIASGGLALRLADLDDDDDAQGDDTEGGTTTEVAAGHEADAPRSGDAGASGPATPDR